MQYSSNFNAYKRMSENEKRERTQKVSELVSLNPYLYYFGQLSEVFENVTKYTNKFIDELIIEFQYLDGKFEDKPEMKKLYEELLADTNRAYQRAMEQQAAYAQQQQELYLAQQQQYSQYPQYQQQNYSYDYQQYGQNYSQQYQQNGYPDYQQQGYQQGYQNNYQGYQAQSQGQYSQNYQHGNRQNRRYNQRDQGQYKERRDRPRNYHEKGSHYDKRYENTQPQVEAPKVEPEPIPEPVPEPEPPKPEPKPTRFSITQIKDLINSYTKEQLQTLANPEVVTKVKEISEWKVEEVEVKLKEDPVRFNKKASKADDSKPYIKTGVRKDHAQEAEKLGYTQRENAKVTIVVGAKQTLQTREFKKLIKQKAATDGFLDRKMEQYKNLDKVELARKQIVYNLNLIVPENLKDVEKDILTYLYESQQVCQILVDQIIIKAWDQPKYASTYAKLCHDFCKKNPGDFKFECGNKQRENPFKFLLIGKVQHSFDQKMEKFPEFENKEAKDDFLRQTKKKILSNVKFIAELIICRILKKQIIKYCISQLFQSFLNHYYKYSKEKQIEDSIFDFHYEAIIEFIENIGEKYESVDEKEKEKEKQKEPKPQGNYKDIENNIKSILTLASPPTPQKFDKLDALTKDDYFDLLEFVDRTYIKGAFPRLSALFQNLIERRRNNWQKHLSAADGPKKLKDIQDEDEQMSGKAQEKVNKEKQDQEKLDKKVKQMFEGWEGDKKQEQKDIRDITRTYTSYQFYMSFLKQVADEKKDLVKKRVQLFNVLVEGEKFNVKDFKKAWIDGIKYLAFMSGDFPFCGAALAIILKAAIENKLGKLDEFYEKFEDEDEQFFMEEIFQKYHNYSEDEAALKYVKPKKRYTGLI